MSGGYDALLLHSFGGPEGPADVMPFLENVTRGRGVPRERLEAVAHHYLALGGVSPINEQNRQLLAALRAELAQRGVALPVYWGNRNWAPYVADELRRIHGDGCRRVLALATSAYSSYSGCRQYREDLGGALIATGLVGDLTVDKVRPYFDHPGFVTPFVDGLEAALRGLTADGVAPGGTRVLFTTHSIPSAMAAASGPPGMFGAGGAYVAQHRAAIDALAAALLTRGIALPSAELVYQSRSGAPEVPWLEPDVIDALRAASAGGGVSAVVIVPIGFVSDHVEVVWDLDTEARETCAELGIRMVRVPTPGTHPAFVTGLVDLVLERTALATPLALSPLGPWPGTCVASCCANPRGHRPTVGGAD